MSADDRRRIMTRLTAGWPKKTPLVEPTNPFLPIVTTTTDEGESDLSPGEWVPVVEVGPIRPTGAPSPHDPVLRVPDHFNVASVQPGITVQVAGLHGGAGTSTVAAFLGESAMDCGVGLGGLADPDIPVLVVARTHAQGLILLRRVAAQFGSSGLTRIRLLGSVMVEDAPVLSKELQRTAKSLRKALPHSWYVRWSEEFRHSPDPPRPADSGHLHRIRKSVFSTATKLPNESPTTEGNEEKEGTAS